MTLCQLHRLRSVEWQDDCVCGELENTCNGVDVAYFVYYLIICLGGLMKPRNSLTSIACLPTENRTRTFHSTVTLGSIVYVVRHSTECYHVSALFGYQ